MSKVRITIETVRSGQPRPYADSVHEDIITLEHTTWQNPHGEFQPWDITKAGLAGKPLSADNIPGILAAYVPILRLPTRANADMLQPYLSSFWPVDGKPGVYRAVSISPFTD